jgi:hypothetical protein
MRDLEFSSFSAVDGRMEYHSPPPSSRREAPPSAGPGSVGRPDETPSRNIRGQFQRYPVPLCTCTMMAPIAWRQASVFVMYLHATDGILGEGNTCMYVRMGCRQILPVCMRIFASQGW